MIGIYVNYIEADGRIFLYIHFYQYTCYVEHYVLHILLVYMLHRALCAAAYSIELLQLLTESLLLLVVL